ncbi:MAG: allophanate hydrolase [Beijerinckiaceae bacterium]
MMTELASEECLKPHLSLASLQAGFRAGRSPIDVVDQVLAKITDEAWRNAWIHVADRTVLEAAARTVERRRQDGETLPLYGVPFGVKDNIDVAGMPTTAACPDFAYKPKQSAESVYRLVAAGAICIGKTNLDQFATGLCGVRSPYGACSSTYDRTYVSGGSSSGSAVAVAAGHVTVALGTDTGGSGRIPAGFNAIVGLKPTVGRVSARGLVPNCPTIDCTSVFASTVDDAVAAFHVLDGFDADDPLARVRPDERMADSRDRLRFGRLRHADIETFGMPECVKAYEDACRTFESLGGEAIEIDFDLFAESGAMLFDGAWIAERQASLAAFVKTHAHALLPVIASVVAAGDRFNGASVFAALQRKARLTRAFEQRYGDLAAVALPTAPRPYTIEEMAVDPIGANNRLGHYSYGANLLDLCAIAIPNTVLSNGVPMGITLLAPAWHDEAIAILARRFVAAHAPRETAMAP